MAYSVLQENSIKSMNLYIPFLTNILKKRKRKRVRSLIRGYQKLKRSDHLDRIKKIKGILTVQSLNLIEKDFSSIIMGAGKECPELIVRQYLLTRICNLNFNKAILYSMSSKTGKIIFGMPKKWRNILCQNNFKVANFQSAVLWQCHILKFYLLGIYKINTILFYGLFSINTEKHVKCSSTYFSDLGSNNIPSLNRNKKSHDIISWYLQWRDRPAAVNSIYHNVNQNEPISIDGISVKQRKNAIRNLSGLPLIIQFISWGMSSIIIAGIDLLRGRWWHAFLLNQAAISAQARILPKEDHAIEYMFHNSNWMYRPLWTYEAALKGAKINFYFYSTNIEGFKRRSSYPDLNYGWKAMNWPNYLELLQINSN